MTSNMHRVMESNGFYAAIMRSDKKKDDDNSSLPPGIPIPCLPVDYLKNRPNFWIGGQGSYVCPIEADWALWFNWTMNNNNISILPSVKGMNPITGARINGLCLEQYKERCPIHNVKFLHGRLCPECNFKWPEQNYIADPMPFYWDGFKSADGTVRQFYFTEDMTKSIPELVIGKEDTVPAFGFCFYQLKDCKTDYENGNRLKNKFPKIFRQTTLRDSLSMSDSRGRLSDSSMSDSSSLSMSDYRGITGCQGCTGFRGVVRRHSYVSPESFTSSLKIEEYTKSTTKSTDSNDFAINVCLAAPAPVFYEDSIMNESVVTNATHVSMRLMNAEVGIGAGAKISQDVIGDRHSIDEWQNKPASIMRIYFVFREQFERYVEDGLRDLSGATNGYLENLPIGGVK